MSQGATSGVEEYEGTADSEELGKRGGTRRWNPR